ncbi:MAG: hypothetical protein K0S33_3772 [Bacteroidetes bacterium]|jgi:ligand-binding SRPBCC domain-containing protein|nr:hypothetical protein [Bacteroidota bacterium]
MRMRLSTSVNGDYKNVMAHFERPLFEALKPAGVDMEVVEFTGSKKGDRVHIRFKSPVKGDWISLITDDGISDTEAFFIDEGTLMPFGLNYWKHTHIVKKQTEHTSLIIDDLSYTASNLFSGLLLYPVFWFGFVQRKKVYRRFFRDFK